MPGKSSVSKCFVVVAVSWCFRVLSLSEDSYDVFGSDSSLSYLAFGLMKTGNACQTESKKTTSQYHSLGR